MNNTVFKMSKVQKQKKTKNLKYRCCKEELDNKEWLLQKK